MTSTASTRNSGAGTGRSVARGTHGSYRLRQGYIVLRQYRAELEQSHLAARAAASINAHHHQQDWFDQGHEPVDVGGNLLIVEIGYSVFLTPCSAPVDSPTSASLTATSGNTPLALSARAKDSPSRTRRAGIVF